MFISIPTAGDAFSIEELMANDDFSFGRKALTPFVFIKGYVVAFVAVGMARGFTLGSINSISTNKAVCCITISIDSMSYLTFIGIISMRKATHPYTCFDCGFLILGHVS